MNPEGIAALEDLSSTVYPAAVALPVWLMHWMSRMEKGRWRGEGDQRRVSRWMDPVGVQC